MQIHGNVGQMVLIRSSPHHQLVGTASGSTGPNDTPSRSTKLTLSGPYKQYDDKRTHGKEASDHGLCCSTRLLLWAERHLASLRTGGRDLLEERDPSEWSLNKPFFDQVTQMFRRPVIDIWQLEAIVKWKDSWQGPRTPEWRAWMYSYIHG